MMDQHNVETARDARREQAVRHAKNIALLFSLEQSFTSFEKKEIRETAEHLLQCVHEYLAYENVIEGPKVGKGKRVKE